MKNLFKNLMLVAVAAMAFTACTETNDEVNANVEKRVFKFVAGFADDTRSGFLEKEEGATAYKSEWFGDEWLKVYANGVAEEAKIKDAEGHFEVELTGNPTDINVYSPASAWDNTTEPTIPAVQTPLENSVDPAAHILKAEDVAVNSGVVTMSHAVAYGKMTVNAPQSFDIKNIEVSFNDGTPYVINADNVENNTFWFATKPAEVSKFTVIAYNDKGKAVGKVVSGLAEGALAFNVGKVSTFSVSGLKAVVEQSSSNYTLVTDANTLAVGDKVIIVAKEKDVAMGPASSNGNNFTQVTVTKDGNIVTFSSDVQILTLEAGTVDNTYAFKTTDGRYLYAASSGSNYLKAKAELDANGSWAISIDADDVATIKAQGTYTRNWMRYNESSSLFSCYGSGQKDIRIYKQAKVVGGDIMVDDPSFELDVTELSFKAEGESKEVNVIPLNYFEAEVTATTDAEWLSIENDGYTYTVTAEENEAAERTATIKFSADGCKDVVVEVSQVAKPKEATPLTVSDFINKADTVNEYILTGKITNVVNEDFGNFDLVDETGSIFVYGIYENGSKAWAARGLKEGDTITLKGKYKLYGTTHEVVDAQYISHISAPFISADNVSVADTATSATINVKSNVAWSVSCSDTWVETYTMSGENDGTIAVTMSANDSNEDRVATFTLTANGVDTVEVKLTQAAYVEPGDEAPKTYTLQFGTSYNSKSINGYTDTWSATCGNFTWNIVNANNNQNKWDYIKMGRKNNASVGTITTASKMPESIKTVTMTVDAVTASKINSIKLYVASDSSFKQILHTIPVTAAKGDLKFDIPTPTANCFYKIEVDCASGSSNGLITISKVVYTNE